MKFNLNQTAFAVLSMLSLTTTAFGQIVTDVKSAVPIQTFFIPLVESDLVYKALKVVTSSASTNFISIMAFAITTDNTVIWYDHWEEGYEVDVTRPKQPGTKIWGDRTASNGCAPDVVPCTDATDTLMAGETIQIMNTVPVAPRGTNLLFDGSDMIYASFPITVTRTGYSENPGSVLAGGLEVYDTSVWGTEYEVPVGQNMPHEAWSLTAAFITAKEPTIITIEGMDSRPIFLDKGSPLCFNVTHQGTKFKATAPIQVALVTGDVSSTYEMRWFTLAPTSRWSNDYMSSVGDTQGKSRMILYNANEKDIVINMQTLMTGNFTVNSTSVLIPRKSSAYTPWIRTGSGARITSVGGESFLAWSFTDTESKAGDGSGTAGNMYDWGFPVVPVNMLTPQVVIGLGFGCTGNACPKTEEARSPVWVAPMDDAFIFIDYNNTGNPNTLEIQRIKKYQSIRVRASNEKKDMSGALIFATKWDGSETDTPNVAGKPVDIAAAWGQDPQVSTPNQAISMDLGTVVVPFTTIRVSKVVNVQNAIPGSRITYTIRVMNVGQTNIAANEFQIFDPELDSSSYVAGTTKYSPDGGKTFTNVADSQTDTPFPLDEGLFNLFPLPRRGGVHEVSFDVIVEPMLVQKTSVVNSGYVKEKDGGTFPFTVEVPLLFLPSISIQNNVYLGQDGGASCDRARDNVSGNFGSDVTYCLVVTNTGNTVLQVDIDDPLLSYKYTHPTPLEPGKQFTVTVPRSIGANVTNVAIATGQPLFYNGQPIPYQNPVISQDPSSVDLSVPTASISIRNTVLPGSSLAIQQSCVQGGNKTLVGSTGDQVTYCFKVTNTGNTFLDGIKTTNPALNNFIKLKDGPLAPGASFTMAVPSYLIDSLTNVATVVGNPVLVDGTRLVDQPPVTSSDDSKVIVATTRSTTKDLFVPTPPGVNGTITQCMLPHWKDAGKKSPLTCRAKEVYLDNIRNKNRTRCVEGTKVKVEISADVVFNAARYDPAFFVATDGGDAMTGTCLLKGFEKGQRYSVVDKDSNTTVVGSVVFDKDFRGGNDKCGDVMFNGGGGGKIRTGIVNTEIQCVDRDNDGSLDFAICFSWRVAGTDGACTLTRDDPLTQGALADVFPGTPAKCFCFIYNVDDITVDPVPDNDFDQCIPAKGGPLNGGRIAVSSMSK